VPLSSGPRLDCCILKTEDTCSFQTSVTIYQSIRRNMSEYLNQHHSENFKSRFMYTNSRLQRVCQFDCRLTWRVGIAFRLNLMQTHVFERIRAWNLERCGRRRDILKGAILLLAWTWTTIRCRNDTHYATRAHHTPNMRSVTQLTQHHNTATDSPLTGAEPSTVRRSCDCAHTILPTIPT
jgi:hypothetical protein